MPVVTPTPNLIQVVLNGGGQIVFGLDQQGNVWTGIVRPVVPVASPAQGDGQYMVTWTKMAMTFVAP